MTPDENDLYVTDEFFDFLVGELNRPARVDPRVVELLRATRGSVRHVNPPDESEE